MNKTLEEKVKGAENSSGFKPQGTYINNGYNTNPLMANYKPNKDFKSYALFLTCGCTPSCGTPTRCGTCT